MQEAVGIGKLKELVDGNLDPGALKAFLEKNSITFSKSDYARIMSKTTTGECGVVAFSILFALVTVVRVTVLGAAGIGYSMTKARQAFG